MKSLSILEMDTTVFSDQDILNNLPELDRMDIEESSFMKGNSFYNVPPRQESSQNETQSQIPQKQDSALLEEQAKKIRDLEALLEQQTTEL